MVRRDFQEVITKAAMVSPEPDEEYLDDPIKLIDFEQKRITAAVDNYNSLNAEPTFELIDSDGDLYIEQTNSVSKRSKKVSLTLPLTFFEIPRNVEQLNRCKPLSIKVVNCMKHPFYYKKYLNKKNGKGSKEDDDDDVMIFEERKVKIRPVTSPYENLKVDSSKNTILERRDSKSSKCRDSKETMQNNLNEKNDLQVDFKKNQGLIGMKITQTLETPSKAVEKNTKGNKLKKQKTKIEAIPKVNTSKNKTASVTSKTENISKTDTFVTAVKKVDEKCAKDIEKNKTVSDSEIKKINGQLVLNSAKAADKLKSAGTKVDPIIDKIISNNTDFASKLDSVKISKVRDANKLIQNKSKTVEKLSVVNEKNCNPKKVPLAVQSQLVANQDNGCESTVQSLFFTESHNVQKQTSSINQAKQESKKYGMEFVELKVVRKDKGETAFKISNDVNTNKTNDFTKYHNVTQINKTIINEENSSKVKETPKKLCKNYAEKTGNGNLNSGHTKTATKKNSILNMKLFKPKKKSKKDNICKVTQVQNQKNNCLPNNAAKVNLIKEQNSNVKQLVAKKLNSKNSRKKNTGTGNDNNLNKTVKTLSLVNTGSKSDTVLQKINYLINPSVMHMGKPSDKNQHLIPTNNNNSSQPSAFYVDKYVKMMEQSSQQPSNQVTGTQFASKQGNFQTHSLLANVHSNNNTTVKIDMLTCNVKEQMLAKQPSNNNSISKIMTNNPSNPDIVNRTNNNISVKQQQPENMNLNASMTHNMPVPNAIQTNNSGFATNNSNQSSIPTIPTQVTRDTHLVKNLPQAFTCNNFVTQPCSIHIPLNIPPEQKRYPRVLKITRRYPETVESHVHNHNASNLPIAVTPDLQKVNLKQKEICDQHNMINKNISLNDSNIIPSSHTYPSANNNQIHYLPTFKITGDNFPKQYPPAFQQNQGATDYQMHPQFHPAAQQVLRHPPFNQSLMSNQQNLHFNTGKHLFNQPLQNVQQTIPQMATLKMQRQAGNHSLTADQLYKKTQGTLPPTCDIQQTVPRHDLNAQNTEFQPQQQMPLKTNLPRIYLRKPITKKVIKRPNLQPIIPRYDAPRHLYPSNFGINDQPSVQLYGQELQQAYSDFIQTPPQNYTHIHRAPTYSGLPRNMYSVNSVHNENYWSNYNPMMLPPSPPPLLYPGPVQQVRPSTSQISASHNQTNCVTSTPKSIAGTTIIGCNNTGPVRKINIMTEPSDVLSMKPNNTLPQRFDTDQSNKNNKESVTKKSNSTAQIKSTETTIDETKKKIAAGGENKKHIIGTLENDQTVNSKKEMLEELSKLTTIESSTPVCPVKELKRVLPKLEAKRDEANLIQRPLPKPEAKQDEANLINRPLPKPGAKREEANLLKTPLSKPDAKQKVANLLKRPLTTPDAIQEEADFIKLSKPGPLSKKLKLYAMAQSEAQKCTVAHKGYSPPILPIPTYQKSLEILAKSNIVDPNFPFSTKNETGTEFLNTSRLSCDEKQEKLAKKISLDEYKKRSQEVTDGDLHVNKIKIEIKSVNPEQDLGYDSDSTIKI